VDLFLEDDDGGNDMTLLDTFVVGTAGVVVGAGWVVVSHIRQLIFEPNPGERGNRYALWLASIGVTGVSLGALFGVVSRVSRWSDSEALASLGLFIACGAIGLLLGRAVIGGSRKRSPTRD
jgi:hypothetical protein